VLCGKPVSELGIGFCSGPEPAQPMAPLARFVLPWVNVRAVFGKTRTERICFMAIANLTDEQLLKRATHAGRNLTVLTTLASLGTLAAWGLAIFIKKAPFPMLLPALAMSLVAAGYWLLALAARRGNPRSVSVVLVLMLLQLVTALLLAGVDAARAGTDFSSHFGFSRLVIPTLVIAALASSRGVLLELQERGLWERAFAHTKPSGNLCVIGGVLLAVGFTSITAGMGYVGAKVTEVRALERKQTSEFAQLIRNEEAQFIAAVAAAKTSLTPARLDSALEKLEALDRKLQSVRNQIGDNARLAAVLDTYGNAVRQWKNGLQALRQPKPDLNRANQFLQLGDKLRRQAAGEYNRAAQES
jgi:hypothetical protein